jgi:7-cyano-7-deazaguanine synthase in queuosine biosynthesis
VTVDQVSRHLVFCGGTSGQQMIGFEPHRLELGKETDRGQIRLDIRAIADKMVQDIPPLMRDLLEIATYVYVTDQLIGRGGEKEYEYADKWDRVLILKVPVREYDIWSHQEVREHLERTLDFLSGDTYAFQFVHRDTESPEYFTVEEPDDTKYDIKDVVLCSGGLDSFTGIMDEVIGSKNSIAMVSHHSNNKAKSLQRDLTNYVKSIQPHESVCQAIQVRVNKEKELTHEKSQRSRSFLFAALGTVIARMYGLNRAKFYENGIVTCHLPFDCQTPQARRTRSTHPLFLKRMGALVSMLIDADFSFENPYLGLTKTDVVLRLKELGHEIQIERTRSCAGAIFRYPHTHCGLCSQCLDRRFATLAARCAENDPEQLYEVELFLGRRPKIRDRAMAAGFVGFAQKAKAMSLEHFAQVFVNELGDIKSGLDENAERVFTNVHALHQRHATQLMGVVSEHIGIFKDKIADGALPDDCLLNMIVNKRHLHPKEILVQGEVDASRQSETGPKKSRKAKKTVASKFKKWPTPGDACFVVDGARTKFHLDATIKDLRLRSGSKAEKLLSLLRTGSLWKDDVKTNICTAKTKPSEAVRDVNRLLNTKVQALGFQAVPTDTEFIGCDNKTGQYFSHLPIKAQDDFEWE